MAARVQRYQCLRRHPAPPPHVLQSDALTLLGANPIFLHEPSRTVFAGELLGWSKAYFARYAAASWGEAAVATPGALDLAVDCGAAETIAGPTILLDAPGTAAYGHWILDVLPRLHASRAAGTGYRIACRHDEPWCREFLASLAIKPQRLQRRPPWVPTRYIRPIIPGFLKVGFILNLAECRAAWRAARDYFLAAAPPGADARLFVSRQGHASKNVADPGALEAVAAAQGYRVVHPERMSVAQQATLFAGARIVVGIDGSGLHNVVFSRPGTILGVITTPERTNFWHLAICHAMQHRCCYWDAPAANAAAAFHDWLSQLDRA